MTPLSTFMGAFLHRADGKQFCSPSLPAPLSLQEVWFLPKLQVGKGSTLRKNVAQPQDRLLTSPPLPPESTAEQSVQQWVSRQMWLPTFRHTLMTISFQKEMKSALFLHTYISGDERGIWPFSLWEGMACLYLHISQLLPLKLWALSFQVPRPLKESP